MERNKKPKRGRRRSSWRGTGFCVGSARGQRHPRDPLQRRGSDVGRVGGKWKSCNLCCDTALQRSRQANSRREEGGGGGGAWRGVWDPKVCVPKMARPALPDCKLRFFPRWSLWSGRGGAGGRGRGLLLRMFSCKPGTRRAPTMRPANTRRGTASTARCACRGRPMPRHCNRRWDARLARAVGHGPGASCRGLVLGGAHEGPAAVPQALEDVRVELNKGPAVPDADVAGHGLPDQRVHLGLRGRGAGALAGTNPAASSTDAGNGGGGLGV